jgi:hypothetical protein
LICLILEPNMDKIFIMSNRLLVKTLLTENTSHQYDTSSHKVGCNENELTMFKKISMGNT